jgi:DNA-binding response OmpR family regulator
MSDAQNHKMPRVRILIVEDDTSVAMMIAYLLDRAGCDAQTAGNAEKALRLVENENFDLITLDVDLPVTSGFDICRRLKENIRLCDTPIVFISGRNCEADVRHGLNLGAVDYIAKPFETFEFAPRLLSHIKAKNDFRPAVVPESTDA